MLAVFDKSVATCPEGLKSETSEPSLLRDDMVIQHFCSVHPDAVSINLGALGIMGFSSDKQNPLLPRLFAAVDDIFCLFQGHIENMAAMKQLYGLNKAANEVNIVIEAYRSLRDRGPNPADHVLRSIEGKFAFIIYDSSLKLAFIAMDADGIVPLYWGVGLEDHLVLSDEIEVLKKACGRSYAPFPKGCFFTSSAGLRSFEHPLKQLKPVPWTDSEGQNCGATFVVVKESRLEASMPRVGSDADWSSHY